MGESSMRVSIRRDVAAAFAIAALSAIARDAWAGDPPGLVSRFAAEGNTNDSLGANNGTPVGNVTDAPGAIARGSSLDGASYVDVAAPTFDTYDAAFTVTAWIRIASY